MKKIIFVLLILYIPLLAQNENISLFPFTGDISEKQGNVFMNEIASKLNRRDYKFVDRSKELGEAIRREQGLGNIKDREYADIATKLNLAGYVLVGSIVESGAGYAINVRIIDLTTSQYKATANEYLPSLNLGNQETAIAIENIVRDIDSKISGRKIPTVQEEQRQKELQNEQLTDYQINSYKDGYNNANIAKWIGRGSWITGIVLTAIPFIIDASWGNNFGYFLVSPPSSKTPTTVNVGNGATYQDYGGFYPESDLIAMRTVFGIGVGLFVGGVITDIVASTMQNSYKKKLEERGIYYSFNPIIAPTYNNTVNYELEFAIAYKFQ
ncbi:FlgO family outer membrane protein [uncultured Brachyspira sp.]|uniref:FlgO family outer membrane protein n=1 Tax=uncultured Brachyspira sp. TaxID=221953 RepID=UPI0026038714|nr:FlgO family outer membrane protein [uncultured Brachyspira sp.]